MSALTATDNKPMETEAVNQLEHFEVCDGTVADKNDDPPSEETWRATEKRLVRKLDMTLMPMVWILYLFNYLDRNNIAYGTRRAPVLKDNSDIL